MFRCKIYRSCVGRGGSDGALGVGVAGFSSWALSAFVTTSASFSSPSFVPSAASRPSLFPCTLSFSGVASLPTLVSLPRSPLSRQLLGVWVWVRRTRREPAINEVDGTRVKEIRRVDRREDGRHRLVAYVARFGGGNSLADMRVIDGGEVGNAPLRVREVWT